MSPRRRGRRREVDTPRLPSAAPEELSPEEREKLGALIDELAIVVADLWFDGKLDAVLAEDDDDDD